MRELDSEIETIELCIRKLIAQSLQADVEALPGHVRTKMDERIQRAMRKNPAFDTDKYQHLQARLEFCDLRELEDIILSKATWTHFQHQFVNKETLATRFGQLAELRNVIRHSRSVDEVTRKEGEAAVLWFKKMVQT